MRLLGDSVGRGDSVLKIWKHIGFQKTFRDVGHVTRIRHRHETNYKKWLGHQWRWQG